MWLSSGSGDPSSSGHRGRAAALGSAFALTLTCAGCAPLGLYSEAGKRRLEAVSRQVDAFDVEISSRGVPMWRGVVRVSRMVGAAYSIEGSEAVDSRCFPLGAAQPNSYTINFRASKYGGNAIDRASYKFDASITRGEFGPDCIRLVTTVIAQRDGVRMRRGARVRLTGDDGLVVVVERR